VTTALWTPISVRELTHPREVSVWLIVAYDAWPGLTIYKRMALRV
jgi:hypothetical protein